MSFHLSVFSAVGPRSGWSLFSRHAGLLFALLTMLPGPALGADYSKVQAIFDARCTLCHGGPAPVRGLSLESFEGVMAGSDRGAVIVAGDPEASELLRRVRGESLPQMPMTGPPWLDDAQIAAIEQWIAAGAPAPAASTAQTAPETTPTPTAADAPTGPEAVKPELAVQPGDAVAPASDRVTWLEVAPILARNCARCHTREGGLLGPPPEGFVLTSYADALDTSDRARIVPGQPGASELLRRVRGQALPRMPFDGPPWLAEREIALIEAWIEAGAPDAQGAPAPQPTGARLRLHGRVSGPAELDGQPLVIRRNTRIDKSPDIGDYVEVRARLGPEGQILVDRMRRRD
ncbi:MAG: hypothetical protein Kow0020_07750 [Wenzhouxiangellaceae bacterium]